MEVMLAGHYQIVKYLSCGGFGQTFLARDCHLPGNPICVVKQLQPKVSDPETLKISKRLFDREAQVLYQLSGHDQIPRLLAHFQQANEFYLVQEFIEGEPLNRELKIGNKLDETATIALLHSILHVLAFVHTQSVIHRDIKPANLIRRSKDNRIVLIDFGAVKEVATRTINAHDQTSVTVAIGSPGYMPSEQQAFRPHFSSDIYAVGMVCIQALSGKNPKDLLQGSLNGEVSCALFSHDAPVSPELTEVLDRMVRYDYRQRYENAIVALEAIEPLIKSSNQASTAKATTTQQHYTSKQTASATQSNQSTHSSAKFKNLSSDLNKQLEQLLTRTIGPVASILLKQALERAVTQQEFVELLLFHVPEQERWQVQKQIALLLKTLSNQPPDNFPVVESNTTIPTVSANQANLELDASFIKCCEGEIAKIIGPISSLIVQRTLTRQPNVSRAQFIEALAEHLPNAQSRQAFRQTLSNK